MRPKACPDIRLQEVGDEVLVLDRSTNQLHHLNATAAWIFERCDGESTVESITDELVRHFEVDAEMAARDVMAALRDMERLGVIALDG